MRRRRSGRSRLSQDYRTIDLEIREAFQHAAAILFLALLALWISLIPTRSAGRTERSSARATSRLVRRRRRDVAQLAAIVEASDDAITGTSLRGDGRQLEPRRRAALRLAARTRSIGRKLAVVVPPDRIEELSSVARRSKAGQGVEEHETRALRKDGTEVDVSLTVSPILDDAGVVTGAR